MRPLIAGDTMNPRWDDGRPTKNVVAEFIKPNDRLTSFERLEIYNRQYWLRVIDCFQEDYPGLRAVLGERKFSRLTLAYLKQFPSTSFTLRNLGQYLIEFIRAKPNLTKPHFQLALDMARMEWAHIEAFDNEAKQRLTTDDLLGMQPAEIHLRLQPYVTLLELDYPLDDFLVAAKQEAGLRSEASNAIETKRKVSPVKPRQRPKKTKTFLAIHRYNDSVFYKRLTLSQFTLLSAVKNGSSLEKACEETLALEDSENIGDEIRDWFQNWMSLGWFCRSQNLFPNKTGNKNPYGVKYL